jgi:hypothetical protein
MTEEEVVGMIEGKRTELDIDPEMEVESAERAIVQYKVDRDQPGPAEDRIAWVIRYSSDWGFVELHVDDLRAEILNVWRSR